MSTMYKVLDKYVNDSKSSNLLGSMYSFTFGALMGDVFLHLLPSLNHEINEKHEESNEESKLTQSYVNTFIFIGIVIWYLIEILINNYFNSGHDHHHHDDSNHEHKEEKSNINALISVAFLGDMFHNFTDGLAIASTFMLDRKLGIATVLACFFHEIPHEIGDFAFLYKNNWSYIRALIYQLLTGWGAIIGAYVWLNYANKATIEMAAIAGGTFIYLSMCMFMEDLRKAKRLSEAAFNVSFMIIGYMFMYC